MARYQTRGEILREYILQDLISGTEWSNLGRILLYTGRGDQLVEFFQEIAATSLVGRLVRAGVDIAEQYDISGPEFKRLYRDFISETLLLPKHLGVDIVRLATEATRATLGDATAKQRQQFRRTAQSGSEKCYLCGVRLTFDNDHHHSAYTLDHVWPRSYGGDSELENFLSCCKDCNNSKKQNYASWAMPSIQAVIHPVGVSNERINEIEGSYKFALHHLSAWRITQRKNISLKLAFQTLGPWKPLSAQDKSNVTDFFNIGPAD
jgi:hypothetical protein